MTYSLKSFSIAAALVTVSFAASSALAANHNPSNSVYLSAHLGAAKPTTRTYADPAESANHYRIKSDYHFNTTGAIGYTMGNWRTELAVGHSKNDADTTTVNTVDLTQAAVAGESFTDFDNETLHKAGKIKATTFMLNGYYDFHNNELYGVYPYVGAGLGAAHLKQHISNNASAAADNITISGSDTTLAYQGIVGIGCALTKNLRGTLDYRYLGTAKAKFDFTNNQTSAKTKGHYASHQFNLGLTYYFS